MDSPSNWHLCHIENANIQKWKVDISLIKVVGIDLAKLVIIIHGVDKHDKCKLRKNTQLNNTLTASLKGSNFSFTKKTFPSN